MLPWELIWIFNPKSVLQFGQLWESAIKPKKSHFKKIVSNTVSVYPKFQTLVTILKTCLNSKLLCPMRPSDRTSVTSLTSNHFPI